MLKKCHYRDHVEKCGIGGLGKMHGKDEIFIKLSFIQPWLHENSTVGKPGHRTVLMDGSRSGLMFFFDVGKILDNI
jgi:hypothetical protein